HARVDSLQSHADIQALEGLVMAQPSLSKTATPSVKSPKPTA
ncbi:hypothetical protein BSPWISOXPB_1702, partial [uncultured Gammaproteobacteria bacterium]